MRVLTEPRNAVTRQFQKFLQLDKVELVFTHGAIAAASELALARKTGARALRSIVEESLLDVMYDIPERTDVRKCIITEETIREGRTPLLLTKAEVDRGVDETNYEELASSAVPEPTRHRWPRPDEVVPVALARIGCRDGAVDRPLPGHHRGPRLLRRRPGPGRHDSMAHRPGVRGRAAAPARRRPMAASWSRAGGGWCSPFPPLLSILLDTVRGRGRPGLDRRQRRGRRGCLGRPHVGAAGAAGCRPGARGGPGPGLGIRVGAALGRGHRRSAPGAPGPRGRAAAGRDAAGLRPALAARRRPAPGCSGRGPASGGPGAAAAALSLPARWLGLGAGGGRHPGSSSSPATTRRASGIAFEFGYGLIEDIDGNHVLDESWYPRGILSPWYIPQGSR